MTAFFFDFFHWVAIAILFTAFLCLYRVFVGPSIIDRIIGLNVLGTNTIALILIIGILFEKVDFFIDIAFVYALINFMGTLAFSEFFDAKGVDSKESDTP